MTSSKKNLSRGVAVVGAGMSGFGTFPGKATRDLFVEAFGEMRVSSLVEISATQIGEAMEYALVTTAAGLVVAIPAVIGYNYIISRIEAMTVEMQAAAGEVIDLLDARQQE